MLDPMGEGSDTATATDAPGEVTADAPAAAETEGSGTHGRLRSILERVPTAWFATLATALFLAVTAAFGGLATVPDPVAALHAGQPFEGAGFAMTVTGAELVDARRATQLTPRSGERVLLVALDARVTGDDPRLPSTAGSLSEIRVDGVQGRPTIIRADDATLSPMLQPEVRSPLLLAWVVPASVQGSEIRVRLPLASEQKNHISAGTRWDFERFGATVTLTVTDGGPGDAEDGA